MLTKLTANLAETPRTEGCFPWTPWANATSCRHPSRASEMQRAFWVKTSEPELAVIFCAQPTTATSKKYRLNIQPTYNDIISLLFNHPHTVSTKRVFEKIDKSSLSIWDPGQCHRVLKALLLHLPWRMGFCSQKINQTQDFFLIQAKRWNQSFFAENHWFSSPNGCQIYIYIYICGTGFWGLFRSPGYIRPPSISPAPTIQPFSCAMPCMAIKH